MAVAADYSWTFDQASRITQFVSPDGTADYNYDNRDQLTGETYSYQVDQTYTYLCKGRPGLFSQMLNVSGVWSPPAVAV